MNTGKKTVLILSIVFILGALVNCGGGGGGGGGDTTPPNLDLTFPLGSEVISGTVSITWTTTDDNPGTVDILLSTDSGSSFATTITTTAPDNGSYSWNTGALADGAAYRIRIIPTDADNNTGVPGQSGADFSLDNTAPSVSITAPSGSDPLSSVFNVTWTTTDNNLGTVNITLSNDSGSSFSQVLASGLPDTGSYAWDTSAVADTTTYRLRIVATDAAGNTGGADQTSIDFVIDNTVPSATVTYPTSGNYLAAGVNITWTTDDLNPDTVDILLSSDSGATFNTVIAVGVADSGTYAWITGGASSPDGSTYAVRVLPTDAAGNTGPGADSGVFTVDNTTPFVINVWSPTNNSVVGGTTSISWTTWDDNPGTVMIHITDNNWSSSSIVVGSTPDTGSYSWDTTSSTDGTSYILGIAPVDAAGNVGSLQNLIGYFHIDNTPPETSITDPAPGDTLVGNVMLAWSTSDQHPGTVDLRLSRDGGSDGYPVVINSAAPDGGTYSWYSGAETSGSLYSIRITPTDQVGTTGSPAYIGDFTIDSVPKVDGLAHFYDENGNGMADSGDLLVVPFTVNVTTTLADPSDFSLPVSGDSLGTGGTIVDGPDADTVTIVLGPSSFLKSRQVFSAADTGLNGASGIDVSFSMATDAVQDEDNGQDAVPSTPVDIIPAFVPGDSFDNSSYKAVLGDFNGDGYTDIASMGFPSEIYINDGNAVFYTVQTITVGTSTSQEGVVGDLDLDGDADIVIGVNNGFQVWGNNGSAVFTSMSPLYNAAGTIWDMRLGDLDRDGFPDLVVGQNRQTDIWMNQGNGTYTGPTQTFSNIWGTAIATGDIDSDGDIDLVISDNGNCHIYTNDGTGTFGLKGTLLVSTNLWGLEMADVDRDGDLDMVAAIPGGENTVLLNNGAGNFSLSGQELGGSSSYELALIDLDRDGDLDLIQGGDTGNEVWMNNGTGNFLDSGLRFGRSTIKSLVAGDLDRDGDLDFVDQADGQPIKVYLGSLSASWGDMEFYSALNVFGNYAVQDLAVGDIDGDGILEIITATNGGNPVYSNNGDGTFSTTGQALGSGDTRTLKLGDVDGDGDLDFVTGNFSGGNKVWINNGAGTFSDSGQSLGNSPTLSVALGDLDKDGDLDMVTGNYLNNLSLIWENTGNGSFSTNGQSLGSSDTRVIALGDVDGDGDLDIVVGNYSGQETLIWENDGTGAFSTNGQSLGTTAVVAIALADVDGDSDLDVLLGNEGSAAKSVWRNNGSGIFTDTGQSLGSGPTYSFAVADVDGDGDLDFASGYGGLDDLWLNNSSGTFSSSGLTFSNGGSQSMIFVDVNRDGALDLVIGKGGGQNDSIWLGR